MKISKLCPYCGKVKRLGRTWRIRGQLRGGIKRSRETTLLRECINPDCPGKGIEKLLDENRYILGRDDFATSSTVLNKTKDDSMNNTLNCPICNNKLISLHSPNHYLCQDCSKLYEINAKGELQEYKGG